MFTKVVVRWWLPLVAMIALAGWTGAALAQEKEPAAEKPKDIVTVAKGTEGCKTFCKLLRIAGLVDTLKGEGPYTVFAPTDQAFEALGERLAELQKPENKAELERILKHHVWEGRKTAADVKGMQSAKTMAGEEVKVTVKDDVVNVDAAKITKPDVEAANGLLHVVDAVLMPAEKPAEKEAAAPH